MFLFRHCEVAQATEAIPKSLVRLPRGARPERHEILRYAQNDTKRRARNDKDMFLCSFQTASLKFFPTLFTYFWLGLSC